MRQGDENRGPELKRRKAKSGLPGDGLAQFLLTGICPFEGVMKGIDPAKVLALLPRPIWITMSREACGNGNYNCKGKKWIVLQPEAHRHRSQAGFPETVGDRVVCEHMGHLIE
jgi:hypothetical protein